jgi:hypothetical protein
VTVLLTFLATLFTWFAAFDCRFFTVASPLASTFEVGIGLWTHQESASSVSCVLYDGSMTSGFDSSFRFARAISMVAIVLSIPVTIMASITIFLHSIKRSFLYSQGVIMLLLAIVTSLEFVALDSRACKNELDLTTCQLSISGIYAIIGAILWLVSGILNFLIDAAEDIQESSSRRSHKQGRPVITMSESTADTTPIKVQERKTLSDGSIKVVTSTTHPDGTRTVTETIEVNQDGGLVEVPLEDLH